MAGGGGRRGPAPPSASETPNRDTGSRPGGTRPISGSMETRARTRPMLRRAGLVAALSALLLPAIAAGPATADAAKRSKRLPVVTKITPKNAFVGDTLTIRGRYFRPGVNKNTVAFKRRGARVVFVKAAKGTQKLLKV